MAESLVVTAAVVEHDGFYLVTRRQQGVHLEGYWEFPGGKCDEGESLDACLRRELNEELGTDAEVLQELLSVTHEYGDRTIELHFIACRLLREPRPQLGQQMRWVARADLATLRFPPADDELIDMLMQRKS
ncbi:MAG TPA: (deoxy)nucleoside triphosphate pyrophosphohydrolase [Vicinamibacterales bacterium]|jgi:8-oxo-dGTP diphosphatase|nr:(deoxy)nucleoside triphosphate pyrophosphohydrolase [Vicinamibacterales bacterium]